MEAPITPTCKIALAALVAAAGSAHAAAPVTEADRLSTYVTARAAESGGDSDQAARLFATLIRGEAGEAVLRQRAITEAIEAGNMALALELGGAITAEQSPLDLRMLKVAEELRRKRGKEALAALTGNSGLIDTNFLAPFVEAWLRADRRDPRAAASLDAVAAKSPLAGQVEEHRALLLLKLRRPGEALVHARAALEAGGGRADRLRLAFADGFRANRDMANANAMLEGTGPTLAAARQLLRSGKPLGQSVDSAGEAFSELMLGFALALNRLEDKSLSIALARVSHYSNPDEGAGKLLLGLLLDEGDRPEQALAVLRTMPAGDPFASPAADAEARILAGMDRHDLALQRAQQWAAERPGPDSQSRLGAILSQMDRPREAAQAYGRAIAASTGGTGSDELWSLHLYRASALEEAGDWPAAKAEVQRAMALSTDNPLLLNFLGYGMLERGESLAEAEAMVRKASALRPDDASITDSLGWAQYKLGKVEEAVTTLERASAGDPEQAEIREHLGDALYTAGRRIEARFQWNAALVAEDDKAARARIESKIATGLTKANAAD